MKTFTFEAIGTHWQIDILSDNLKFDDSTLENDIKKRIDVFDKTYSRFIDDSLITNMSKKAGEYTLPEDAEPLISLYKKLYEVTDGLFTPLIGQTLADAGYDAEYSLQEKTLHKPKPWNEVIEYHSQKLTLKEPALLDFGAAGKGYLVDIVASLLKNRGISSFCIDASGDIVHSSTENKNLRIGLEHPEDKEKVIGVASISNESLCASATNRRKWSNYHHIINPITLTSPQNIVSTWVVAKNGLLADALATCLFFCPAKVLLKHYSFEYCILYADFSVEKSAGETFELFT